MSDFEMNRYGTPEMVMHHIKHGRVLSVTECERYADAALQRIGKTGEGMPATEDERKRFVMEELLPHIYEVLCDAGEISHPPEGEKLADDGPELAKVMLVGVAAGTILGFNDGANAQFGKGNWSL